MLAEKFEIKKNSKYGFYQAHPTPSQEEIAEYYAKEFYSSSYPQLNNSSLEVQERDKAYHDLHREHMYQTLCELLGSSLNERHILDFGCGFGHALKYFKSKNAVCYGCDPAPEAVAYCQKQGLNVVLTQMKTLNIFKDIKFDVVMLLNVLEHVADPVKIVKEIKEDILKKGGILVIEVPNDFNIFQKCATKIHNIKEWWVAPPAHLNYFNKETLTALLKDHQFEIEHLVGSFPLEIFLLFGDNYIGDPKLGRECHQKRMTFEMNMIANGYQKELQNFYKALAQINLGRQMLAFSRSL